MYNILGNASWPQYTVKDLKEAADVVWERANMSNSPDQVLFQRIWVLLSHMERARKATANENQRLRKSPAYADQQRQ